MLQKYPHWRSKGTVCKRTELNVEVPHEIGRAHFLRGDHAVVEPREVAGVDIRRAHTDDVHSLVAAYAVTEQTPNSILFYAALYLRDALIFLEISSHLDFRHERCPHISGEKCGTGKMFQKLSDRPGLVYMQPPQ